MKRGLLILAAATLLTLGTVGTAAAKAAKPADRDTRRGVPHPHRVQGTGLYGLVPVLHEAHQRRHSRVPVPRGRDQPGERSISLNQRCTELENGIEDMGQYIQISYPFTFSEPPELWDILHFPTLTGYNHHQCEITLYTYHSLILLLPIF